MGVTSYSVHVFVCRCDVCGERQDVEESLSGGIYNGAQAVRSLGWSFGKDKSVKCDKCRMDNFQYVGWYEKQFGHK